MTTHQTHVVDKNKDEALERYYGNCLVTLSREVCPESITKDKKSL